MAKGALLLRTVSRQFPNGATLSRVAHATRLNTATSHRLLSGLVEEGLLSFDPYTKTYNIGFELLMIAESAQALSPDLRLRHHLKPLLKRIAVRTEDTVYLSIRSGLDAVCIDRIEGDYLPSANTLLVGARRPLGVGAGSMALIAAMPDKEALEIIRGNEKRYASYSHLGVQWVQDEIRRFRERGYVFNDARIIPDVGAVAIPILDVDGAAIAAVSVAATLDRLGLARRKELIAIMADEVKRAHLPPRFEENTCIR